MILAGNMIRQIQPTVLKIFVFIFLLLNCFAGIIPYIAPFCQQGERWKLFWILCLPFR